MAALSVPLFPNQHLFFSPNVPAIEWKKNKKKKTYRRFVRNAQSSSEVYRGVYGPWSIDETDVREVLLYRAGLVTSAASFIAVASTAFLSDETPIKIILQGSENIIYGIGAGGLGLSLLLIHIYVTPLKRTLQLLWAAGILGSIVVGTNFAAPAGESIVQYVVQHPVAIWAVGPVFASLTGLVFKEGLCYGKLEAGLLFFVIPSLLLGHLTGVTDKTVEIGLLATWMLLFGLFAARKFTQPIKDDIGDKSIFMFNALPEPQKRAVVMRMQQEKQT